MLKHKSPSASPVEKQASTHKNGSLESSQTSDTRLTIEICERVMDHHYVPARDSDGYIIVEGKCVKLVQAPKYHASIKEKPGHWGCGTSRDEALGSLIGNCPEVFGITIEHLGKLPR